MTIAVLGIDLAKHVFQLHGVDAYGGAIMSKRVGRAKLAEAVVQLAPRVVAMEACCGAHYWGRRFRDLGLEVRLEHHAPAGGRINSRIRNPKLQQRPCKGGSIDPHMPVGNDQLGPLLLREQGPGHPKPASRRTRSIDRTEFPGS